MKPHPLKIIRDKLDMTTKDFAAYLTAKGVTISESSIYFYEVGRRRPRMKKAIEIERALNGKVRAVDLAAYDLL